MTNDLLKKKCIPCEKKGMKPMNRTEAQDYVDESRGWTLSKDYMFDTEPYYIYKKKDTTKVLKVV